MAEPEPVQVVKKPVQIVKKKELEVPDREVLEEPFEEPEMLVRSLPEPPAQFSERPEPPMQDFELPIVRMPQGTMPLLEEEVEEVVVAEEETPPARTSRDVVQLYFEEEDSTEVDATESMDLVQREAAEVKELADPDPPIKERPKTFVESLPASEIQSVAAQEKSDAPKTVEPAVQPMDEVQTPSDAILAELKPVRSIEIRKAVEVPPLAEMDNPQLREPADQAGAMLRKRPPFKFWPVYRDPWVASRDSFAFHHNPLWFEDPNLERCGRGKGHFTSVSSFLQFNTNIAFLPYRMTAEPWHACVRTLPDCTVCQKFGCDAYLPPWSWRAAAVQAGCIVGFIYAIP